MRMPDVIIEEIRILADKCEVIYQTYRPEEVSRQVVLWRRWADELEEYFIIYGKPHLPEPEGVIYARTEESQDKHHDCHQTLHGAKGTVRDTAHYQCSPAIDYCKEYEHGFLWAGNGRNETMVNFCPFCGYKAKRSAVDQDEWEKIMEVAAQAKGTPK